MSIPSGAEAVKMQPMTAVDTLYAMDFPCFWQLKHFVLHDIGKGVTDMDVGMSQPTWMGLSKTNYALLKRIFESRLDRTVVREAGAQINANGGMREMIAIHYIYCHFICLRLKDMELTEDQWVELLYGHARKLEYLWDGIGNWLY